VRDLGPGRRRDPGVARGDRTEHRPGADIEVVENAGHFVHKDHPERFVTLLNDFVRTTEPASHDRADWREMLTHGPDSPAVRERAGQRPLRPVARLSRRRTKSA
jgi:hypothetical protein